MGRSMEQMVRFMAMRLCGQRVQLNEAARAFGGQPSAVDSYTPERLLTPGIMGD